MKNFFKTILFVPFYNLLIFFAYLFGGSVGWAVITLTVVIRVILLPSSIKAARASVKLQMIQPKMNEIRQKHKNDQKKQSQEMMKMYKEEGASPFGTCLPLLIQLPFLWILYRVFLIGVDTSRYELLYSFTPRPEILNATFLGMDLAQPNPWVLPLVAGGLQLVLSFMTMPPSNPSGKKDPTQAITRQMMFIFPVITVIFARSFPAALALYWMITTLFSVGQQYYVNKTIKNKNPKSEIPNPKQIQNSNIKNSKNKREEEPKKNTTRDYLTRIMSKRLNKQDKKKGVEISIREKR